MKKIVLQTKNIFFCFSRKYMLNIMIYCKKGTQNNFLWNFIQKYVCLDKNVFSIWDFPDVLRFLHFWEFQTWFYIYFKIPETFEIFYVSKFLHFLYFYIFKIILCHSKISKISVMGSCSSLKKNISSEIKFHKYFRYLERFSWIST